jgi:hypothetical protein
MTVRRVLVAEDEATIVVERVVDQTSVGRFVGIQRVLKFSQLLQEMLEKLSETIFCKSCKY